MEKNKCYIDYLDSENNFKVSRKDFLTYEEAFEWLKANFEKWDIDMITYY